MALDEQQLQCEFARLKEIVSGLRSVVIGFSGGVDSTFLLKVASDVLGAQNVVAASARSESFPEMEMAGAVKLAKSLGVRHIVFDSDELSDPNFARNAPDRCYFCKKELFSKLWQIARSEGLECVADASNHDDATLDYRPGMRAARELEVRSPLQEARLRKAAIRELSKRLGLPTHDKPSMACLASRIPYGESITAENLARVKGAETVLREMGLKQFRVRSDDRTARIELGPQEDAAALAAGEAARHVVAQFKQLGYTYVTLDLEGYRTGSMNEVLPAGKGMPQGTDSSQ